MKRRLSWLGCVAALATVLACDPGLGKETPAPTGGKADDPGATQGEGDKTVAMQMQMLVDTWVQQVLTEHGVSALPAVFSGQEVLAQTTQFANAVTFHEALAAAMKSFIEDGEDCESPRALLDYWDDPTEDALCPVADLSEHVRCYMRQEGSRLLLVHRESESGGVADSHLIGWAPEGGESVEQSWIFELVLESLSDHSHWAIVKRARGPNGEIQVHNYGFN